MSFTESTQKSKVYIETIKQLQDMIISDSLKPGDRIPSERELAERLNVGRSSVREALRALELLGLIETKRGEGTFLKDFGGHHLVELIGSFILKENKAKEDLIETRILIESQAILLACELVTDKQIQHFKKVIVEKKENFQKEIMSEILFCTNNRLLYKIWLLLSDYDLLSSENSKENQYEIYEELITSFEQKDCDRARHILQKLYD